MISKKPCKVCTTKFTPRNMEPVCSPKCAIEYNRRARQKKEQTDNKAWRSQKQILLDKTRKHSYYEDKLQEVVNAIARAIDNDLPCISCDSTAGQAHGGHYHAVGSNNSIRFNLHNIHKQDAHCNMYKHANQVKYSAGLRKRYGKKYYDRVQFDIVRQYPSVKLTIAELSYATQRARRWLRFILIANEGALAEGAEPKTPAQRIMLRSEANKYIGIYKN